MDRDNDCRRGDRARSGPMGCKRPVPALRKAMVSIRLTELRWVALEGGEGEVSSDGPHPHVLHEGRKSHVEILGRGVRMDCRASRCGDGQCFTLHKKRRWKVTEWVHQKER